MHCMEQARVLYHPLYDYQKPRQKEQPVGKQAENKGIISPEKSTPISAKTLSSSFDMHFYQQQILPPHHPLSYTNTEVPEAIK